MRDTPRHRRAEITEVMRRRVMSGVAAGTLRQGDRLPSARELAAEFDADPRLVLAAYRTLADEGVVEIRQRSGIYVAAPASIAGGPALVAEGWLADVLFQGIERGLAAQRLGDWFRRLVTTRRLRVAVVATSADEAEGMAGELRADYGVDTVPFAPEALDLPGGPPEELTACDFAVTIERLAGRLAEVMATTGKAVVPLTVRPDDVDAEWRLALAKGPVHVVVSDERFLPSVDAYASRIPAEHGVRTLVVGRDDLDAIPADATVYVTRSARARIGGRALPGRLLPHIRAFDAEGAKRILTLIVEANLRAMRGAG
jgi:DNA-binding transcriptional regulator YhcF (GntR family)